jgi:hypothetical protein
MYINRRPLFTTTRVCVCGRCTEILLVVTNTDILISYQQKNKLLMGNWQTKYRNNEIRKGVFSGNKQIFVLYVQINLNYAKSYDFTFALIRSSYSLTFFDEISLKPPEYYVRIFLQSNNVNSVRWSKINGNNGATNLRIPFYVTSEIQSFYVHETVVRSFKRIVRNAEKYRGITNIYILDNLLWYIKSLSKS